MTTDQQDADHLIDSAKARADLLRRADAQGIKPFGSLEDFVGDPEIVTDFDVDEFLEQLRRPELPIQDLIDSAITPKAFANHSPGLALRKPWDHNPRPHTNAESVNHVRCNPFRVEKKLGNISQGCRKLQPWAQISQRLRRNCFDLSGPKRGR